MKKILSILLLIPCLAWPQQINFKKSVDIGGYKINLLEELADVPTKKWLLMFLGTGELGPADGSQILDLDNYGYQKFPSFKPEFNILVPQAVKSYSELDPYIQDYMVRTYGEDIEIVMVGHSLGARNVMEYTYAYNNIKAVPQVVGFMPVAGEMSWPLPLDWCITSTEPIMAVAGDKDGAIFYGQTEKYVDAVNSCQTRTNKAVARIIPGLNHTTIMDYVFKPDKEAEGYKFIMSCFTPETKEIPGRLILRDGKVLGIFENGDVREIPTN
jgi:hypothetical protein